MNLQPNKIDGIPLPVTNTRISAGEWNQLVGSCMAFITAAGLTPDASDNEQFLNAFKAVAASLELVGANTNLSNLTAAGNARFTAKANTDLSNVNTTGKNSVTSWCTPNYSAIVTGLSFPYTAPRNGLLSFNSDVAVGATVTINGYSFIVGGNDQGNEGPVQLLVSKNDVISFTGDTTGQLYYNVVFIPLKGAN